MKSITTKFLKATGTQPSRIMATSIDGHTLTVPFNQALEFDLNHAKAAFSLARNLKWNGTLVEDYTEDGNVYMLTDSTPVFRNKSK